MGHVASHFVSLDPNLEAENELLALVPQLMAELLNQVRQRWACTRNFDWK